MDFCSPFAGAAYFSISLDCIIIPNPRWLGTTGYGGTSTWGGIIVRAEQSDDNQ
jgi:hypothetical protein